MTNIITIPECNPFIKEEKWMPIKNLETQYLISNYGRVFSQHTKSIIKPEIKKDGYLFLRYTANNKRSRLRIHRIVAEHFIPNKNNKPHINHINSIRSDNRAENLEWCTPKENIQHSIKNGNFFSQKKKDSIIAKKGIYPKQFIK